MQMQDTIYGTCASLLSGVSHLSVYLAFVSRIQCGLQKLCMLTFCTRTQWWYTLFGRFSGDWKFLSPPQTVALIRQFIQQALGSQCALAVIIISLSPSVGLLWQGSCTACDYPLLSAGLSLCFYFGFDLVTHQKPKCLIRVLWWSSLEFAGHWCSWQWPTMFTGKSEARKRRFEQALMCLTRSVWLCKRHRSQASVWLNLTNVLH